MLKLFNLKAVCYLQGGRIIKLPLRGFCEEPKKPEDGKKEETTKIDEENKIEGMQYSNPYRFVEELTYIGLRNNYNAAEKNIEGGTYYLKSIPDNNYFGEIPVYICPAYTIHNVRAMEFSSFIIPSVFAYLSYYKIIFTSSFFFPFYSFLAFATLARISLMKRSDWTILSISLIDESKVRVQFLNGQSHETSLKNMNISTGFINNLNSMDDSKLSKLGKNSPQNNLLTTLIIYLTIDHIRTCPLLLRSSNFMPGKLDIAALAYINPELFYGIINKKTKQLALKESI
jgi:hypothetical protein